MVHRFVSDFNCALVCAIEQNNYVLVARIFGGNGQFIAAIACKHRKGIDIFQGATIKNWCKLRRVKI